jgi:hypothetical protein
MTSLREAMLPLAAPEVSGSTSATRGPELATVPTVSLHPASARAASAADTQAARIDRDIIGMVGSPRLGAEHTRE